MTAIEGYLESVSRTALLADECSLDANGLPYCGQGAPLFAQGETWPHRYNLPLLHVLSLHTPELPYVPDFLSGFEYWSFFIENHTCEQITDPKTDTFSLDSVGMLVIRKYTSLSNLARLDPPKAMEGTPLGLQFRVVRDYPSGEALEGILSDRTDVWQEYLASEKELLPRFNCQSGIKLGGYPLLIQPGPAFFRCLDPDFAIQIDMTEYFMKGDAGIGYINRALTYSCWESI